MEAFNILFEPGEATCLAFDKYGNKVSDVFQPYNPSYQFFSINPMINKRAGENITAYRNILLESDNTSIKSQLKHIDEIKLPYATLTFSGNKSVHCIISLKTPLKSREEYDRYVELAYKAYGSKKIDSSCKDPGRFSRYPNGTNDKGNIQELLKVGARVDNTDFLWWAKYILGHKQWMQILYGKDCRPIRHIKEKLWMSKATTELIQNGITEETSRHNAFTKAVVQLKKSGYDDDEVYDLLADRFTDMIPERGIRELKDIIKWAKNIQPEEE